MAYSLLLLIIIAWTIVVVKPHDGHQYDGPINCTIVVVHVMVMVSNQIRDVVLLSSSEPRLP